MTGFNADVPYNAELYYNGGVPAIMVAATAAVEAEAAASLDQRYRHWLDAAPAVEVEASASVALTIAAGATSDTALDVEATAVVARAAGAAVAAEVGAAADLVAHRRHWLDAASEVTVDASAGLALGTTVGASVPTVVGAKAALSWTRQPTVVTVAGSAVLIEADTLELEYALSQRSTARFTVIDRAGALAFDRGQRVVITQGAAALWSGYVDSAQRVRPSKDPLTLHALVCIDQQYLADKRIAARTYVPGMTCGEVVADLHEQYLAAEGVTLGAVEDGATLEQGMLVNYQPVSGALDALVEASDGYIWTIDQDRVLTFRHRSSLSAPWEISQSTIIGNQLPAVTSGNPDFRNVQWILGGLAITDPQTETRVGDGDTQAWAMSYPLAKVPAVKLNGVDQVVGIKGLQDDSTYDFGWNKGDAVISQSSQAAKLTSSDTLTVTYQGQYAVVARVDDPTGISDAAAVEGGSGIVEQATSPANVNSAEQAFGIGRAKLDAFDRPGVKLEFETDRPGLAAGQWATVNLPDLGLDGVQMLIESVSGYDRGDGRLRWSVSAVDGPTTVPWQRVLGAAPELRKDDLVSVGSGTVVALVVSPRESTGWSEEIEESPMVCELLPYTLPVTLC